MLRVSVSKPKLPQHIPLVRVRAGDLFAPILLWLGALELRNQPGGLAPPLFRELNWAWSHCTRVSQGRYELSFLGSLHFVGFPFLHHGQ